MKKLTLDQLLGDAFHAFRAFGPAEADQAKRCR
jgi:hypothetical protein